MLVKVVVVTWFCLLTVTTAEDSIINYDAEDHKHRQTGDPGNAVRGSYSYIDADGKEYTVNYVADENGYRAEGAHLPGSIGSVSSDRFSPKAASTTTAPVAVPAPLSAVYPFPFYRNPYRIPQFGYNYGYAGYPYSGYGYNPAFPFIF